MKNKKIIARPKKMAAQLKKNSLYNMDFVQWISNQAELLKNEEFNKLDILNLIEEIESLGRSEKRVLISHLEIMFIHMLKIRYQPIKHTPSWDISVSNSRDHAEMILEDSPSLKSKLSEFVDRAYKSAINGACLETGLEQKTFPTKCPWKLEYNERSKKIKIH